jgi:hypothetical protein
MALGSNSLLFTAAMTAYSKSLRVNFDGTAMSAGRIATTLGG